MNIHEKNYVVISAHQAKNTKTQNALLQAKLAYDLLNLVKFDTFISPATGRYNGIDEESFAVAMPDENSPNFDRIQDGLIALGNKYNQNCLLLVFQYDPPTACLYPLNRDIQEGHTDYIENPWIEISDTSGVQDFTTVQGVSFIIDYSSDVTPPEFQSLDALLELLT